MPALFVAAVVALGALITVGAGYPVSAPQALARRIFFALPLFLLWLAAGVAALRPPRSGLVAAALITVAAVGGLNYFADRQLFQPFLAAHGARSPPEWRPAPGQRTW